MRWLPWVAVALLVIAGLLLLPGFLGEEAGEDGSARGGPDDPGAPDARLLGTGRRRVADETERGTLAGLVTLDGRPARARLACEPFSAGPLPDDPGDRWAWLLRRRILPGVGVPLFSTAADGSFAIDLDCHAWRIQATCADGSAGWTTALVSTGETTRVHLDLRSGSHVLRGRVRWADGTPLRGFVMARLDSEEPDTWEVGARTLLPRAYCDAEGRFRLPPLAAGFVVLHAVSPDPGFLVGRRIQVPWPHEIDWVVDAGYRTVTGRVVDAATGAGILLAQLREPWGTELSRARTDAEGRFTLRTDVDQVIVSAAGYTARRVRLPTGEEPVTIALGAAARLSGRVLRASDGSPVEGAVVHAIPYEASDGWIATATSAADGTWSVPHAPSGPASLVVLGGGACSVGLGDLRKDAGDPFRIDVPPSGALRRDLHVEESASLEGQVVRADGQPAGALTVRLAPPHRAPVPWHACRLHHHTPDGAFSLPDLIPGVTWRVRLDRDAGPAQDGPQFLLRPGEHLVERIRLPHSRRAVFEARDARSSAPLKEAYAVLEHGIARADAQGRIVVEDLEAARGDDATTIGIEAPGYAPTWVDPWVAHDVQVVPLQPSAGIAGRIEGLPEGASFKDVRLRAAIHIWHSLPVAPDGTFGDPSFPDVPDRLFADLRHDGRKWSASAIADPGATDIVLTLVEQPTSPWWPVQWTVRVKGPDGRPVPQVVYDAGALWRKGGNFVLGYTAHEGRIAHRQGRGAQGWVRIRASRDARGQPLGYAAQLVGPLGSEGGEIEVSLRPGLAIEGRVVDGAEAPVPGVRVEARFPAHAIAEFEDRTFVDMPVRIAYTDADGRFRLDGLEPGIHDLVARGGGRHTAPPTFSVEAGRTDVIVTLGTAHAVDVTVEDPRGRPVPSARYSAGRPGGPWRDGSADGRGLIRIAGFDPEETYTLHVHAPDDRPDLRGVRIDGWRPAPTAVRLLPGASLSGQLLDSEGGPVPDVQVHLFRGGKRTRRYRTDDDGSFRFWGLDPGERVGLAPDDSAGADPAEPVLEVAAGRSDVVLRFVRGPSLVVDLVGLPALDDLADVYLLDPATGKVVADATASYRGRAVFTGSAVDPERTYDVLVGPLDLWPDRLGYRTGLRVREAPWPVEIERGHLVRARITNPAVKSPRILIVEVELGHGIEGMVDPQGVVRVPGVPAGRWTLVVRETYTGRVRGRATIEVPGGEVSLTLNDP